MRRWSRPTAAATWPTKPSKNTAWPSKPIPSSEFLTSGLAELYVKTGRIRDAVIEAQDIIKRDPKNLEAHKLLGRIYLRSLGDMPGGNGSDNVLKLAIEQYEQIVEDRARQRRRSSSARPPLSPEQRSCRKPKANSRPRSSSIPSSEEAVTTLAMLYTDEGDTAHALQGAQLGSRLRPLRQALCRSGRRLRTAQGIQERHRRLSSTPSFSIATISTPFAASPKICSTTARPTPPSSNTKSSPTPIPKTRKPTSASPKFIAARASTTSLSRT